MRIGLCLATIAIAATVLADERGVFVTESETTVTIGGAPWRVYLDAEAKDALDRDGDGQSDRFSAQYTADQAAKAYLRASGGGEAFTGLGGLAVFRHTVKGRTVFVPDGPARPIDPDLRPIIEDPDRVTIYVDAPDGASAGDDRNDGRTPETAVATVGRGKAVASSVRRAGGNKFIPLTLAFRGGDTFGPFGLMWGTAQFAGQIDNYTVITSYGEARATFASAGTIFRMKHGGGDSKRGNNFEFRNIRLKGQGGAGISWAESGGGLRIVDCVFDDAHITVQCLDPAFMYDRVEILRTVVKNCTSRGGHRSGIFLNRVNDWSIDHSLLYRNGWNGKPSLSDSELGDDVHNHGLYATAFCSPAKSFRRNICIFNAGAGAQLREGGNVEGNFIAWNGQTGLIFVADGGNKNDDDPGTGSIVGNFITDHFYVGTSITDCDNVLVKGNWFVQGTEDIGGGKTTAGGPRGYTVQIDSIHGANPHGGTWHGINRVVWEDNVLVGGRLTLRRDGWGAMGGEGLLIRKSIFTEPINYEAIANKPHLDFVDPLGKVIVEDEARQTNQPNPGVTIPDRDALQPRIDSGELDAAALIRIHIPQSK